MAEVIFLTGIWLYGNVLIGLGSLLIQLKADNGGSSGLSCSLTVQALLRRLEKRIYVELPDVVARTHIFTSLLDGRGLSSQQLEHMSQQTEGHSGSDIAALCKEVAMRYEPQ